MIALPESPIDLPQRKVGRFEVRHSYAKCFETVSAREWLLTGRPMRRVTLEHDRRVHELREKGLLWIADIPMEVRQHQEALSAMFPRGRVLVGGLGLGIMATLLARMPEVEQVDVVEIAPEVAELCRPADAKVNVIVDDFKAFLAKQTAWPWSCAFVDLWRGTSEGDWWDDVMPIRRLIRNRFGEMGGVGVQYWAEDQMLAQVGRQLLNVRSPHWYYREGLRLPMTRQRARWFLQNIGSPLWERRYGSLYADLRIEA